MVRRRKKKLTAGTYYDDKLGRYVQPGEPDYDKGRFREMLNGAVAKDMRERKR